MDTVSRTPIRAGALALGLSALCAHRAALAWAVRLAGWLPLLARPIRVVDGVLIGIGGVWLAASLWRRTR